MPTSGIELVVEGCSRIRIRLRNNVSEHLPHKKSLKVRQHKGMSRFWLKQINYSSSSSELVLNYKHVLQVQHLSPYLLTLQVILFSSRNDGRNRTDCDALRADTVSGPDKVTSHSSGQCPLVPFQSLSETAARPTVSAPLSHYGSTPAAGTRVAGRRPVPACQSRTAARPARWPESCPRNAYAPRVNLRCHWQEAFDSALAVTQINKLERRLGCSLPFCHDAKV